MQLDQRPGSAGGARKVKDSLPTSGYAGRDTGYSCTLAKVAKWGVGNTNDCSTDKKKHFLPFSLDPDLEQGIASQQSCI